MSARLGQLLSWAALLVCFHLLYGGFFPNQHGRLGHDFAYFLPAYLDGYVWFAKNGLLEVPWFTPSFCAGLPFFADPQSGYYSLPQWLTFLVDPLTASYLTLLAFASIGFFGMVRLCRSAFALPSSLSLFAAGLYFLNGFLPHRFIVGEISFHAVTLVPWVAYWLLRPTANGLQSVGYGVLAGLAGAYAVQAGMNILIIPGALSVVAVMLIHRLDGGRGGSAGRAGVALVVSLAVSASKLAASAAFIGSVPRAAYAWPGIPSLQGVAQVAALALFAPSELTALNAEKWLTNVQWPVLPHEWAYQFTAAPLLALLFAACFWRSGHVARRGGARTRRRIAAVALGLLLVVPLAFLYYTPDLNRLYTRLPIIGGSSWPMRWLVLYVPLLPLAVALSLRRSLASRPRLAAAVMAVTLALTLALNFAEPRYYYHEQPYDPSRILAAHERFAAGAAVHHAIHDVGAVRLSREVLLPHDRNDGFLSGSSPMLCYNPIFGYRQERFRTTGLTIGPVLHANRDRLNFKNPACYLYPRENGCQPGDHFRVDERDSLKALTGYRPMPYARSALQIAADRTSTVSLAAIAVFLVAWASLEARRRWATASRQLGRSSSR
jgi:hypothetical protein